MILDILAYIAADFNDKLTIDLPPWNWAGEHTERAMESLPSIVLTTDFDMPIKNVDNRIQAQVRIAYFDTHLEAAPSAPNW